MCYLLGDFSINLLNHDSHLGTGAFIDMLFSYSFVPLITRPTWVTATLIDNILTNNVENINHSDQDILVTVMTDHYPVFHIHRIPNDQETKVYFMKRIYSMKNKQAFIESIAETDWSEIYNVTSTEIAFNAFHKKLMNLLKKCFMKIRVKKKYHHTIQRKPWLSEASFTVSQIGIEFRCRPTDTYLQHVINGRCVSWYPESGQCYSFVYRQVSNIRRTLVGN